MQTICAISTPYGSGGIAVCRVSGEEAIIIVNKIFRSKYSLKNTEGGRIVYGHIVDGDKILDEVLISVFRAPHSFTGENIVEISCHGSLYVQKRLLELLIDNGCRLAYAGEFTQRAFLNGKLDLSEAEAVADLIASESRAQHTLAINQLRGGLKSVIQVLRDRLLKITSLIELELDFADHEELEFADRTELQSLAQEIESKIEHLIGSFKMGNAIKCGVPVAIIGVTNAGKSTLLNALIGEERAIVSDIHGTTRDTIEDVIIVNGIRFRLIDTAGIRSTDNEIEEIGIERSIQAAQKAEIIIHVVDLTQAIEPQLQLLQQISTDGKTILTVYNKSDIADSLSVEKGRNIITLSAKSGDVSELLNALSDRYSSLHTEQKVVISNARHYEALSRALAAIVRVQEGLKNNLSGELLSMDLQDCLKALGEITGQITSQEVLNNIFKHFCIGK